MYIYCSKKIKRPICIHFLCGNKYFNRENNKRNVLKKYIDSKENNYALILEKLFTVEEYGNIGFNDLGDVELMASHYARSIIILHETVSTAAEIALFGSKNILKNKILVVYAPENIIKTDSVGTFIKNAFFLNDKVKSSEYNYEAVKFNSNNEVVYYNTFFKNNEINSDFIDILNSFWKNSYKEIDLSFDRDKVINHKTNSYSFDNKNGVRVILSYQFILSLLISILLHNDLLRDNRDVETFISNICLLIKEIITNTISFNECRNLDDFSVSIKMEDDIDIYLPIKFCIYILLKAELISKRDDKYSISDEFKNKNIEYKELLEEYYDPDFFGKYKGVTYE